MATVKAEILQNGKTMVKDLNDYNTVLSLCPSA